MVLYLPLSPEYHCVSSSIIYHFEHASRKRNRIFCNVSPFQSRQKRTHFPSGNTSLVRLSILFQMPL